MKRTCDVLVIGSGASGLAAAVTAAHAGLQVIVAEKEDQIGGTSAWSGGWLWIPRNPLARQAGIDEPEEEPLHYLRSEIGNRANDPRIEAFLSNGPEMVSFFRDHTAVEWIAGNVIPDFHESPGAAKGGRSVCAAPFDGRELGSWISRLRSPLDIASLWGMGIASGQDLAHFFNATRKPSSLLHVTKRLAWHVRDLALHGRGLQLVNGNALVARLLKSALDLNVEVLTGCPATELLREGERVTGAVCGGDRIHAGRGVVLAAGGFPHDSERKARMFEHAPTGAEHRSAAPSSNTGDGIHLGETAGGRVADDFVHPGAWAPVSLVLRKDGSVGRFPHLVERAKPGFIAVGPDGKRFVNEANSYHDFMSALFSVYSGEVTPHAWIIADHKAQRRFGLGWAKPFPFSLRGPLKSGYLKRGRTLAELAGAIGVPAGNLTSTVEAFNAHAHKGEDPDFGRGTSAYNRIQGDPDHKPNSALGVLQNAPYYAVKVIPGSLGTFAGLRTNEFAQVVRQNGDPVPGLYAVGNDMASIMGGNYPSGGITLGPGMTFGYIAGRILAGQPVAGTQSTHFKTEHAGEGAENATVL